MIVCQTKRLSIRHFTLNDAGYIVRQLNEPSFIRYIADKQVRTIPDAEHYLVAGPLASYEKNGFGLNAVVLKEEQIVIGMCGLVKRDELDHPDLGFAFLPAYWGRGYAGEAGRAVLETATETHGLETVLGVTLPGNLASNRLLEKIGFTLSGKADINGVVNNLYEYKLTG